MSGRLSVVLGRFARPRTVARLTGRVPLRETSVAALSARELALPAPYSGDGGESGPRVLEVSGAVIARTGAVLDGDFRIVRAASSFSPRVDRPWVDARSVGLLPRAWQPSTRTVAEPRTVATLVASTQRFYFHWLFDILPRVALVRATGCAPDAWYVDLSRGYQRESLARLGLPDTCVIDASRTPTIETTRAIVPLHRVENGRPVPAWVVEMLREAFSHAMVERPIGRRLWISRRDAMTRRLIAEPEVTERLGALGFEDLRLSGMRIEEQARAFSEASIVVAPHGSGLANLAFASPGTRVLELLPGRPLDLYRRVAAALGCVYESVQGVSVGGRPTANGDFRVPAVDVIHAVERMARGV